MSTRSMAVELRAQRASYSGLLTCKICANGTAIEITAHNEAEELAYVDTKKILECAGFVSGSDEVMVIAADSTVLKYKCVGLGLHKATSSRALLPVPSAPSGIQAAGCAPPPMPPRRRRSQSVI